MLDIRKIRENPGLYREKLARRHSGDDKSIDNILALDEVIRRRYVAGRATPCWTAPATCITATTARLRRPVEPALPRAWPPPSTARG